MNWKFLEAKYDSKRMRENIQTQGRSLQLTIRNEIQNIKNVARKLNRCKKFIFSGCGDKYIVALSSQFIWNYISTKQLNVIQSKVLTQYPPKSLDKNTCVVFISQSGTTADVIEACKLAIERNAFVVCITNLKDKLANSLVEFCENYKKGFVLKTHTEIYPEEPLPSTNTFHTSLAVLNLFTMFLNNANDNLFDLQINQIPKVVDCLSNSEKVKDFSKKIALKLKKYDNFYVVGDGPRFTVAKKHAKIMMMEGVKVNACDVESEEFVHSLIETLENKPNQLILLKPLDQWKNFESYLIVKKIWPSNKIIEINPFEFLDNDVKSLFLSKEGDLLSPFIYTVITEWICYYLALIKKTDPGVGKFVKKIRSEEEMKKISIKKKTLIY